MSGIQIHNFNGNRNLLHR